MFFKSWDTAYVWAVYIVISLGHCENTLLSPSLSLSHARTTHSFQISPLSIPDQLFTWGLGVLTVTRRAVSVLPEQFQSAGLDWEADMFVESKQAPRKANSLKSWHIGFPCLRLASNILFRLFPGVNHIYLLLRFIAIVAFSVLTTIVQCF